MTKAEFLATDSGNKFLSLMRLSGLRPVTTNNYARRISVVLKALGKKPDELAVEDPNRFVLSAARENKSNIDIAVTCVALRFFMTRVLGLEWKLEQFPRVLKYRKQRSRPLTREEILALLQHTPGRRYQLLFSLMYGSGLRLGEACRLRLRDLDFQNHKIYVRDGKGGRQRETVLARNLARDLQSYVIERRPLIWLFPSNRKSYAADTLFPVIMRTRPVSGRSVQRAFDTARAAINPSGLVTVHSLRHSFATHLVEYSMPLFSVQRLLGHQHLSTTLGYLSSLGQPMIADFSPFDRLRREPEAAARQY